MAVEIGPRLAAFLNEVFPVVIATAALDGEIGLSPVWFELANGEIVVNGGPGRLWLKRMERTGNVNLLFLDPKNMFRFARVRGRLLDVSAEGADKHINHLSHRYTGADYRNPTTDRLIIRIQPTKITGSENWAPWDVTEAAVA